MKKVSDETVSYILKEIETGSLEVGDKLPSEEVLSKKLDVSRVSLREAIQKLNTVGIIETKHGKGSYIASNPLSKAFKNIFPPIVLSTDLESIKLLEARRFIEVGTTRLAAKNIDARQIEKLEGYIEGMEKATRNNDLEEFQKSDLKFHLGIAEGCDNEFLFALLQGLRNLMEEQLSFVLNIPGRVESSLSYHKQIFKGLKDGNPEKASQAVAEHIRNATHDIRESEKNELLSF